MSRFTELDWAPPDSSQFLQDLREHPKCNDYFNEFLNMVEDNMLVIGRPCGPQELYGHGRWTSKQVHDKLSEMYENYKSHCIVRG